MTKGEYSNVKTKGFIPNTVKLPPSESDIFFRRVIKLWSVGLPDHRHLTDREIEVLCYMLINGNALGQVVDYTKGSYRKQIQSDLELSKQGYSNILKYLVRKRWMTRSFDEYLNFFNYNHSKELVKIRNMYFSGDYEGLKITIEMSF